MGAAQFAKGHLEKGYWVLRALLLLGELGVFLLLWWLLARFDLPQKQIIFYWFNPLVILELMGNLHFEGLVLFFYWHPLLSCRGRSLGMPGCTGGWPLV